MSDAVIVGAFRTPVGRRGGALSRWHPGDLLGHTLRHLVDRTGIDPVLIDDVIAGCAMQHEHQSGNIGRHAVLSAGFPESVPAVTIDRQCGSGQQAVSFAAQGVMAGSYEAVIACGVESMSQTPLPPALLPDAPPGPQYSPREMHRYQGGFMAPGPSSELMNETFGFSREELDAFGIRSHQRAFAAAQAGVLIDHLVPISTDPHNATGPVITTDEGIRGQLDPARIASLPVPFKDGGCTSAANSSQLSDGAAALLITSREFADRHGLIPLARIRAMTIAADDPIIQFTAVISATYKALKVSGLSIEDIDLFESTKPSPACH